MRTLYIVKANDWGGQGDAHYALVADDGEYLAGHVCSVPQYARGDLHDNRPQRQAEWRERFGEYRVLWIGEDDLTEKELLARNAAWGETAS